MFQGFWWSVAVTGQGVFYITPLSGVKIIFALVVDELHMSVGLQWVC